MGTLTLSNFRDMVNLSLDQRTEMDTSTAAGQTRLDRTINFAMLHVSEPSIYRHHELEALDTFTLAENDHDYDLAGDVYTIFAVKLTTDDIPLRAFTFREWVQLRRVDARPTRYARFGNTIYLDRDPTSDEAGDIMTVYHYQQPDILSSTSDTTVLNEIFDQVIWVGATWYGWEMLGQQDKAEAAKIKFGALINEFREKDRFEHEDYGYRVDPTALRWPIMRA